MTDPCASGKRFVVLTQRSPQLAADRDPTTTDRVARLDVDGHDAGLADESPAPTPPAARLIEETAHPAVHQEEDEGAAEHEGSPIALSIGTS